MKQKWTLNLRLLMVTVLISIPIIMLLLAINADNVETLKKQKIEQNRVEIQSEVSQLDTMLELLDISMANLTVSNPDFRLIAQATTKNLDFWRATQRSIKKIQNLSNASTLEYTIFAYYPKMDIFVNEKVNKPVTEQLRPFLQNRDLRLTNQWKTLLIDENAYILRVFEYDDFFVGAWISYDELIKKLGVLSNDAYQYHFLNSDGIILDGKNHGIVLNIEKNTVNFEDKLWYISSDVSSIGDFTFMKMIRSETVSDELPTVTSSIMMVTSVLVLALTTFILGVYRWVISPMNHMKKSMTIIEAGDMTYRIPQKKSASAEFDSAITQFNTMMDQLENLKIVIYEGRLERQEIELQHLSQQIQPHFILNSLNTLYNYCDRDQKATKEMILLLSKFYRYVVNVNSKYVLIGQELEHIDNYLKLQKVRLSDAFEYEITCGESLEIVPIPPFIIEGFVINAMKYGMSGKKVGWIQVEVSSIDEFNIRIRISDNGDGFSDDVLDSIEEYTQKGIVSSELGVGIKNSIERLKLIYKDQAQIRFYNKEPQGAVVEIHVELQSQKEHVDGN